MTKRLSADPAPDPTEYEIYPDGLTSPYKDRRREVGLQLYESLGIDRHDRQARWTQRAKNFDFFGAPAGLFCYVSRQMGAAQWCDLGMYLQTLMLLLKADGVDTCPQEAWSLYHRTVDEIVRPVPDLMLFCGVAIGYGDPDHPANSFRASRAPAHEVSEFLWSD